MGVRAIEMTKVRLWPIADAGGRIAHLPSCGMAVIAETSISLRFFGDDLVPDAVTATLGKPPTGAETKGEVITNAKTGRSRVARRGGWRYRVERRAPGDLDGQIEELFGALSNDLSAWRPLADKYQPDLFVGLFLKESNEGIEISAKCLDILASRGVSLSLDVYGPLMRDDE
ncbi:MAG: DUF4279 domain-containing protein [Terricaulis sp.]